MPLAPGANNQWIDYDSDLMGLISEIESKHGVSSSRIALTGFSRGANGTVALVNKHPGTFKNVGVFAYCSSVPSVSGFSQSNTWLLVGSADGTCGTDLTYNLYNAINNAGYKVKQTTYSGIGHTGALIEKAISDQSFIDFLLQ